MTPWDEVRRRAAAEAAADCVHDMRRSPHWTVRLIRAGQGIAGIARALFSPVGPRGPSNPFLDSHRDLAYALRRLRATPAFSIFAAVTLALGIGATTAIYSVVYALVLRPPEIPDIEQVLNIYRAPPPGSGPIISFSWLDYQDLRAQQDVFSKVAAWTRFQQPMIANGQGEFVMGEMVSGDFFPLLGIRAALGRMLQPSDDEPGASPSVLLSQEIWHRVFNDDPAVVGKTLKLGGTAFEIVGVASSSFRGVDMPNIMPTPMWVTFEGMKPIQPNLAPERLADRDARLLLAKGRLKSDRTLAQARSEIAAIGKRVAALQTGQSPWGRRERPWTVIPMADIHLHESMDAMAVSLGTTLMVAVGLVLMVACTNLANLVLARTAGRRQEFAVRLALGATRWRLVRELLVESAVIGLTGGALGIVLGRGLLIFLSGRVHIVPGVSLQVAPQLNLPVFVLSMGATCLALLVFGLIPAWRSTRDVRQAMSDGSATSAPRWRGRGRLISAQVMVSVALLAISALCVKQIAVAANQDPGIDVEHLALVQADFTYNHFDQERGRRLMQAALPAMPHQSGIVSAAIVSSLPFGMQMSGTYAMPNAAPSGGQGAGLITGSPEMFQTLGLTMLKGRGFDARDAQGAPPVAVVSASLARGLFDPGTELGHILTLRDPGRTGAPADTYRVVGIVSDTAPSPGDRRGIVYLSIDQHTDARLAIVVRTSGDPSASVDVIRRTIVATDAEAPILDAGTGVGLTGAMSLIPKIAGGIAGALGGLALVLSMAGLYGLMSALVIGRTREIGVRLALGAEPHRIVRLIARQGLAPVMSGLVAGLVLGALVRMSMRPFFTRLIPELDWVVLALVPIPFMIAALVACYLPARRAARIDPNVALRDS